jgi:uncharacterized protein with HEPN domain
VRRDAAVFLDDIDEACEKVNRYTNGFGLEQFRHDEKTIDAVLRNLEVIGEAAKNIPDDLRAKIPVDWKRMAGLRDVLIHEYFGIDLDIIWDVVQTKIPELHRQVSLYLSSEDHVR